MKYKLLKEGVFALNGQTQRAFVKDEIIDQNELSPRDLHLLKNGGWLEDVPEQKVKKPKDEKSEETKSNEETVSPKKKKNK